MCLQVNFGKWDRSFILINSDSDMPCFDIQSAWNCAGQWRSGAPSELGQMWGALGQPMMCALWKNRLGVLGFAARMCTDDIVGNGCLHCSPATPTVVADHLQYIAVCRWMLHLCLELGRELEVENSRLHELASRLQ